LFRIGRLLKAPEAYHVTVSVWRMLSTGSSKYAVESRAFQRHSATRLPSTMMDAGRRAV
jgi:hypothetical protein